MLGFLVIYYPTERLQVGSIPHTLREVNMLAYWEGP